MEVEAINIAVRGIDQMLGWRLFAAYQIVHAWNRTRQKAGCLALSVGFADNHILRVHGQRMLARYFDLRNVRPRPTRSDSTAQVAQLFERLCREGIEHDLGDLDPSALFIKLVSRNAMSGVKDLL